MGNIQILSASTRDQMLAMKHKLAGKFSAAGFDIQIFIVSAWVALTNNNTNPEIHFSQQYNGLDASPQELIAENDGFVPVAGRLGVSKVTDGNFDQAVIYQYADKTIFDGAAVGGSTENECVTAFFNNSRINLTVEKQPVITDLLSSYFQHQPAQQVAAANTGETGAAENWENFKPMFTDVGFTGKNKNIIRLDLNGPITTLAGDGTASPAEQNYAVVELLGFKLQGMGQEVANRAKAKQGCMVI